MDLIEEASLKRITEIMGATFLKTFDVLKTTHLIVYSTHSRIHLPSTWPKDIWILEFDWIKACLKQGYKVDEKDYDINFPSKEEDTEASIDESGELLAIDSNDNNSSNETIFLDELEKNDVSYYPKDDGNIETLTNWLEKITSVIYRLAQKNNSSLNSDKC